jgi:hypothetical protein
MKNPAHAQLDIDRRWASFTGDEALKRENDR